MPTAASPDYRTRCRPAQSAGCRSPTPSHFASNSARRRRPSRNCIGAGRYSGTSTGAPGARAMCALTPGSSSKPAASHTTTRSRWSRITTTGCSRWIWRQKFRPTRASARITYCSRTRRRVPAYATTCAPTPISPRAARTVRTNSGRDCNCLRDSIRARALAQEWAAGGATGAAIAQKALNYFREQGFVYTLDPPLLGRDSVDEFLFGSKRGFCEHYASSFVFLMRAAGVPARVVTGYQGGEINPVDGYMIVRQSDAHAWAEIWLRDRGWVRVDPTAAVSPLRVEAGVAAAVPATDPLPLMTRTTLHWLLDLRYNWDALANKWNQLVLGYNPERQREFLTRIGMSEPSWENMALTLFWGVGGLLALLTAWLLRRMRTIDTVQRLWLRFCAKLGRKGWPRAAHEGPADFVERTAARYPAHAERIRAIGGRYIALRYGESADARMLAELRLLVREFGV